MDKMMNERQNRFISIVGWLHLFGRFNDSDMIHRIEFYVNYEFETPFNQMQIKSYFTNHIRRG